MNHPDLTVLNVMENSVHLIVIYSCPIEVAKGLTDKGQFQYLTKLKGPQEGTYLYTTQILSFK